MSLFFEQNFVFSFYYSTNRDLKSQQPHYYCSAFPPAIFLLYGLANAAGFSLPSISATAIFSILFAALMSLSHVVRYFGQNAYRCGDLLLTSSVQPVAIMKEKKMLRLIHVAPSVERKIPLGQYFVCVCYLFLSTLHIRF